MAINETTAFLLSRDIKNKLLDENVFWLRIDNLISLLVSIITWWVKFQSNKLAIHKVFSAFKDIKSCLTKRLPVSPIIRNEETRILKSFEEDRHQITVGRKIHLAAIILDLNS